MKTFDDIVKLYLEGMVTKCKEAIEIHKDEETKRLVGRNAKRIEILIGVPFVEMDKSERQHLANMLYDSLAGGDGTSFKSLTLDEIEDLHFEVAHSIPTYR